MKLGLIGFPQVGKRTLFMLLTGQNVNEDKGREEIIGLATVRDARFDRLVRLYAPRKEIPAHMEFVLLPDLDNQGNRNASILQALAHMDVICHMVRAFQDETVFHVQGSINPARDILFFNGELQLNDLIFIEKRLERIKKEYSKLKEKIIWLKMAISSIFCLTSKYVIIWFRGLFYGGSHISSFS